MRVEDLVEVLEDCKTVLLAHISSTRLEAMKDKTYTYQQRNTKLQAVRYIRKKLEETVYSLAPELDQQQMAATMTVYSDLIALLRSLSTANDSTTLDSANSIAKLRDISELKTINAIDIVKQQEDAKSDTVPDFFRSI